MKTFQSSHIPFIDLYLTLNIWELYSLIPKKKSNLIFLLPLPFSSKHNILLIFFLDPKIFFVISEDYHWMPTTFRIFLEISVPLNKTLTLWVVSQGLVPGYLLCSLVISSSLIFINIIYKLLMPKLWTKPIPLFWTIQRCLSNWHLDDTSTLTN